MTFPPDTLFVRSPAPMTAEVDGELVMMDVDSGTYFNLDRIGTDIWAVLADAVRFDDLCLGLQERYDAPLETIRADVGALLSRMLDHKLVRTVATPQASA